MSDYEKAMKYIKIDLDLLDDKNVFEWVYFYQILINKAM